MLDGDQDEVHAEVFERLEDRDGKSTAGLVRVIHAEPLVGRVTAAIDHELGSEESPHRPRRHEDGGDQVEGATDREFGTALFRQDDAGRYREQQSAERREATLPDSQDLAGVIAVVAEHRDHMHEAGTDNGGEDNPQEDRDQPVGLVPVAPQPPLEVEEAKANVTANPMP